MKRNRKNTPTNPYIPNKNYAMLNDKSRQLPSWNEKTSSKPIMEEKKDV